MPRPLQRPRRRGEGRVSRIVPGSGARPPLSEAVPHRGVARRQAAASAHLPDLRCRGGRGPALPRDGVRRRRHAREVLPGRQPPAGRPRGGDDLQVHARAGVRASPRRHAPRHEAGEHPAHRRDEREDHRFRRRADCERRDDADQLDRLAGLHVPRAGEGAAGRPPHRHLFGRGGAVPPAHRSSAFPGGEQLQPALPDHQRQARAALQPAPRPAGKDR